MWSRYGEVIDELPIVPGSDRALISPDSRMREAAGRGDYPSVVAFLVSLLASPLPSTAETQYHCISVEFVFVDTVIEAPADLVATEAGPYICGRCRHDRRHVRPDGPDGRGRGWAREGSGSSS